MKRQFSLILTLLLVYAHAPAQVVAQSQQPPRPAAQQTPPAEEADDNVVRITSNLVQFDAVVVDRQGRQVTDLRPEEFEVTLGGEPQQLTNFSYVSMGAAAPRPPAAVADRRRADRTVPPARLRAGEVRRTIALVADDLNASFESLVEVRRALKNYVDEQMQPRDLVAIIRTSAGMGALQQFTSDKRLLHKAIERVRWYPRGSVGVGSFAPIQIDPQTLLEKQSPAAVDRETGQTVTGSTKRESANRSTQMEDFRNEKTFSVGTLGALNFIIRGMEQLPGRKSVVMFSEGFEFVNYDKGKLPELDRRVLEELRRLTDLANRASVVIYTVDARGLPTLAMTAEDNTTSLSSNEVSKMLRRRGTFYAGTQVALTILAHETGGFAVRDRNDLAGGVAEILDDQKGYYLIGFRPDEKTFDRDGGRARFNELRVKVKRAGASVRTRAGFYGFTDAEAARPVAGTRLEQLFGALSSPVASGDMNLRLTSVFSADPQKGSFVSSLMHIDMSQFKFTEEADGWHKAVIDLVALTVGDNGSLVDEINRTETVRVRGETLRRVLEDGLVYVMAVPVKQPGAYQLRVAVRDAATEKLGSASQFIEVPDLKKNRLALSGLVMEGAGYGAGMANASVAVNPAGSGRVDAPDPMSSAAVRRFRQGAQVDYHLNIYNARVARETGRPQLRTQMRIYREGQVVFAGQVTNLDPARQQPRQEGSSTRVQVSSRFRLGADLPPGEYVLQVIVTDALAGGERATVAGWTDFEIVQ